MTLLVYKTYMYCEAKRYLFHCENNGKVYDMMTLKWIPFGYMQDGIESNDAIIIKVFDNKSLTSEFIHCFEIRIYL